ncbi:response regulator transcription factor [Planomonospora venezuelensis]|uniref:DNA-binding NarL/FixJ family response regulator n=1 Tax=Planomonospora venezuelensis TaxID=1999 RepID=A0A841DA60_PLAVE|nr:response regulator transcription factor [Planomonospora venezuelensis]MBB5966369.1 DNA-binding NarL/FixJ family response regulator [Planomonospora venezuelensis]GIN02804.1 DNA-binding response regulator [Planomonospora venezuelensis]
MPSSEPPVPPPIRVVLVEDHDMVAEAIGMALDRADGMEVVARSRSIAAAVADADRFRPDVVVLDRRLPDGDGISVIGRLAEAAPGARILVLTGEATASVAARVAEAGGAGLVLKSSGLRELEAAVREVAAGRVAFAPELMAGVLERLTGRARRPGGGLTGREKEALSMLAEGLSTDQVAERLGVARNTARNHIQRVLEKLGARSKLEAVAIARREGLVD